MIGLLLVAYQSQARRPDSSVTKKQKMPEKNKGPVKKFCQKKHDSVMSRFDFNKLIKSLNKTSYGQHEKQDRKETFKDTLKKIKSQYCYEGRPINYVKIGYLGQPQKTLNTVFEVQEGDILDIAQILSWKGKKPLVLSMANAETPGGGVLKGAGAQEEQIVYRSNLYPALVFAKGGDTEFIDERGGVYIPNVLIFKNNEQKGYSVLPYPFSVDVVASAALNLGNTSKDLIKYHNDESVHLLRDNARLLQDKTYTWESDYEKSMKCRIRAQFRIAVCHKHDTLLLSDFGCGAFKNDPGDVARFYKEILQEKEFCGRFKTIIFGIASGENCEVFKRVFSKLCNK
jgi:uncharacterized protein (TIGR02452 family)